MTTTLTPTPTNRLTRWFGDEWPLTTFLGHLPNLDPTIRIEESVDRDGDKETYVVRAEAPGIDPEKDVEISLVDGTLMIAVERREREESKDKGTTRSEFRYGSFHRTMTVPKATKPEDVVASYTDGILEVRVPMPDAAAAPTKVKVTKT